MILVTANRRLFNKEILCNGTTYQVNESGEVNVSDEAHVARLCAGDFVSRDAVDAKRAEKKAKAPDMKLITENDETITAEVKEEETVPVDVETEDTEWIIPEDGADWPDPNPDMPRDYLFKMAEAYDVKFAKNIKTETLVERINAAMYAED